MTRRTYSIDGSDFSTEAEFFREVSKELIAGAVKGWIHNLDAFKDLLYRGDDKPEEGFILI
jgi:hypothetical protein